MRVTYVKWDTYVGGKGVEGVRGMVGGVRLVGGNAWPKIKRVGKGMPAMQVAGNIGQSGKDVVRTRRRF